jgi:membrane protein implicated in regulation of membrane protease activity
MRYDYTPDPFLNDRAKRLLGKVVVASQAIDANGGRVRVGDSEWSARGGPAAAGDRVRIVDIEGNCLKVEPEHVLPPT